MNAIESYRRKNKLTYIDMARLAGVTVPTLWRHARGVRGVSFAIAQKYHKKLSIPLHKIPILAVTTSVKNQIVL